MILIPHQNHIYVYSDSGTVTLELLTTQAVLVGLDPCTVW